ncbi:class I lanthipeptide [Aquimarina sp. 2201CG5-10]|nr:class I lanthipeptide [Aquimarina sp. 2201CG5-10]MDY8137090.1 class I lanthipeptide [Aquimarina sp. 2201CG5-10]
MKKEQVKKISLKKLTIARINLDTMHKIKGGSSLPTVFPTDPKLCNADN